MNDKLYGAIYINEEKKILICKNPNIQKLHIPIKKGNFDLFYEMMQKEFEVLPFLKKLYRPINIPYFENEYQNLELLPYLMEEYPEYPLKNKKPKEESGQYTEKEFYSFEQLKEMFNAEQLSESAYSIILQLNEEGLL